MESTNDLRTKIELLRNSELFVNPSDDYAMNEKQAILLVLTGHKPISEVASGHWEPTETGRQTVADDPNQVAAFLESLGLAYELRTDDSHAVDALVSFKPELFTQYEQAANDTAAIGRLFGFPDTAAAAMEAEDLLPFEEQEKIEREAGLNNYTAFRFSRENWQSELELAKQWFEVIKENNFANIPS